MIRRLKAIAVDPVRGHANVTPLRGERVLYRLRQGKWRAIYRIHPASQEVRVLVIDTRERVYR